MQRFAPQWQGFLDFSAVRLIVIKDLLNKEDAMRKYMLRPVAHCSEGCCS
jgi:hypothetical protein